MRYFLVVGEASADLHAAGLIESLRAKDQEAVFQFMGGDLMAKASGTPPIIHYREVAFMGIVPVLLNLGRIQRAGKQVQEAIREFAPDVVIPVDFAGFNFRYILPFVREYIGCPILYYIAPKLWAWKAYRIRKMRRYVDHLLCILPFEVEYFSSRGLATTYVGNPCIDAVLRFQQAREETCSSSPTNTQKGAEDQRPQIAILSGSRRQELEANLRVMLEATKPFQTDYRITIAGAPGLQEEDYTPHLRAYPEVSLVFGQTYELVRSSVVAIVTSGTATLETALIGTPLVVCYRMGGFRISRWVFDKFFTVSFISLVNLILGREVVAELIGAEMNTGRLRQELQKILPSGNGRERQQQAFEELWQLLGREYARERAADTILSYKKL